MDGEARLLEAARRQRERMHKRLQRPGELEQLVKEALPIMERFRYATDIDDWTERAKALLEQEVK